MDRHFGNFVQTLTGADVRLYNPELNIFVEVLRDQALLYFKQEQTQKQEADQRLTEHQEQRQKQEEEQINQSEEEKKE